MVSNFQIMMGLLCLMSGESLANMALTVNKIFEKNWRVKNVLRLLTNLHWKFWEILIDLEPRLGTILKKLINLIIRNGLLEGSYHHRIYNLILL